MSQEVHGAACASPRAPAASRCRCGAEMTRTHDPMGPGDEACTPCRDRSIENDRSNLAIRGIDVYGP